METNAYLTVSQAARVIGVTRGRVYQMLAEGKLAAVAIAGVRFLRRSDVEAWSAVRAERARWLARTTEHLGSASTSEEGENVTDE